MFDDDDKDPGDPADRDEPAERQVDPQRRAIEQSNEFRAHAELAAVFEACRKFDASVKPGLDIDIARDVQRGMARADKSRADNNPILPEATAAEGLRLLDLPAVHGLSTGDYHVHRRPGETMIVRWIAGEQVDTFYERLQAHFDAALGGYRDDERTNQEWKQDAGTLAFLDALDAMEVKLADRYFRGPIRAHGLVALSTQTADEMNIAFLCDHVMGVGAAEVVGRASAPPEDGASEADLAWFFKLFLLRGTVGDDERMCFFTFLQKSDDSFGDEE